MDEVIDEGNMVTKEEQQDETAEIIVLLIALGMTLALFIAFVISCSKGM